VSTHSFTPADLITLKSRGIPPARAERQLDQLLRPPPPPRLAKACTLNDGILTCAANHRAGYIEHAKRAAAQGRLLKFVPASGAATRMFEGLASVLTDPADRGADLLRRQAAQGSREAANALQFIEHLADFAFTDELERALDADGHGLEDLLARGEPTRIVEYLLKPVGLGYADLPKALLAFHRREGEAVTAFEEHLVEAAQLVRDKEDVCRLHFTVSPEHLDRFKTHLESIRGRLQTRLGVRFDVGWSIQKPSSDTLAVDLDGNALRQPDGNLVLRPGGHGALIENLCDLDADVVSIKNIDNVVPEWMSTEVVEWKLVLTGMLLELQERVFGHIEALQSNPSAAQIDAAAAFVSTHLDLELPDGYRSEAAPNRQATLLKELDRPLRVCGVVRNTGEPGGGPFWVRDQLGELSRQIIEGAQVDANDESQVAIFQSATHFNPVDIVCGLRNWQGRPFDLRRFVDQDAVFVAQKSLAGKEINALELPGLWNGAMAAWNTIFVEVPIETFNPVKTVNDLLRATHQPIGASAEKR
jgi:hypothetical protein